MPVAVSLPTKLRVDRRALIDCPESIDAALAAALGRALANSRRLVLEPRGEYLDVVPEGARFSWTGLSVDVELRAALEARLAALYEALLLQHGIGTGERSSNA